MVDARQGFLRLLVPQSGVNYPAETADIEDLAGGDERFAVQADGLDVVIPTGMLAERPEMHPGGGPEHFRA